MNLTRHPLTLLVWLGLAGLPWAWAQTPAPVQFETLNLPEASSTSRPPSLGRFQRHAVVSAHPLASQAGADILRRGGNAIDAAVATQMALAVVEPQSSGLGGGGFAVVFDGEGVWAYDGREAAPARADAQLFMHQGRAMGFDQARQSPLSVGVPGLVPLLWTMHQRHGRLPWRQLLAPAIELAERGFAIGPRLHRLLDTDPLLRLDPQALALFYDRQGRALAPGQRLRNPELGWALRRIAAQGPRAIQQGPIAFALLRRIAAGLPEGSAMNEADLRDYEVRVTPALCFEWQALPGTRLCGPPPPSSGPLAVGQILNLRESLLKRGHRDEWHVYTEAARLAYADRAVHVADLPPGPALGGDWLNLLQPTYLERRAALVQDQRLPSVEAGSPTQIPLSHGVMPDQAEYGTTHLNAVDAQGWAVALTSSLESAFGARRMVNTQQGRAGGFLLNHQLTDFALQAPDAHQPALANAPGPGKRPRSSMSPLLLLTHSSNPVGPTEQVSVALGSAGGPFIIHHVAQTLIRWQGGADASTLANLPRWGLTDPQGPIWLEAGTRALAGAEVLHRYGHPTRVSEMSSGLHAIWRDAQGHWITLADPRREGAGAGR